jgi:hypothetical protein
VLAISQNGVMRVATSGLDGPNGIVFDRFQRPLVSAIGLGGHPQIALIMPDTTYQTLSRQVPSPNGMAFGPDGMLYVADTLMNRVVRMSQSDQGELTAPEVYASGLGLADGIAFDDNGDLPIASAGRLAALPDQAPSVQPSTSRSERPGAGRPARGARLSRLTSPFGDPSRQRNDATSVANSGEAHLHRAPARRHLHAAAPGACGQAAGGRWCGSMSGGRRATITTRAARGAGAFRTSAICSIRAAPRLLGVSASMARAAVSVPWAPVLVDDAGARSGAGWHQRCRELSAPRTTQH